MKRIFFIGSLVIIAVGIGAYFLVPPSNSPNPSSGNQGTGSTASFGSSTGTASSTNPGNSSSGNVLELQLRDGSQIAIPDFTKENQPPTANAESGYQVAGSNTSDFQILFYPQNSGILISLLAEPLGAVRLAAEDALRAKLGLSDSQLCRLTVDVMTPGDVNFTYAGRNLGLSFCPGAVTLPQ